MTSDTRQASGGSSRPKRRLTDITVDDDSASNPKRQRVSRACDSCRSKKDKCDGAQPICSTCASLSRPCTYKANPKKRGLPTGYIRTLELLWGLVFTKIQGSEEVVRALLRAANIPSHLATMGKEAEGSDTLMSSWKNSIVLKEIERLLTFLEQPEDEQQQQDRGRAHGDNLDSPFDVEGGSGVLSEALEWHLPDVAGDGRESSLIVGPSPVKTPTATSTLRQASTYISRDSGTQTLPVMSSSIDLTSRQQHDSLSNSVGHNQYSKLPSNPWPLLDIYFSYTQCWLPILEKHDILRTAFRHGEDDQPISLSCAGSGDYAALWAVLALASLQQASISTTRQDPDFPDDRPDASQLYARAKSLIPGEDGVHETGHVQALLILSLIKLGQQDWAGAWILVGQAVRIAQSLGLHTSAAQGNATEESKAAGRSKHVFLGCFVLETLVAVQTGQVPSLRKGDLTKVGPINEDGLEEWHPWEDQTGFRPVESSRGSFHRGPLHALSTFNRLVSLMCVLNDLCCWGQCSTNSPSHLEALERQLQLWVSSLPKGYRVDLHSVPVKTPSPHIFGLEMMYEGVATAVNLQLAAQRNDRNGLKRAADSSKRLFSLLHTYMESYSLSATCPTFGMILTLGVAHGGTRRNASWALESEPAIKSKLHSFSTHLASIWSTPTAVPASIRQRTPYNAPSLVQTPLNGSGSHTRTMSLVGEARPNLSIPDSFLSPTWMRTASNMEDNAALSLPTPTPSLHTPSLHTPCLSIPPASVSGRPTNGTAMLSDIATPFPAPPAQYQHVYTDASLHLNSMVDIEGYSLRRPRIAPDLDALFDELASLDGTERVDNQPEFMQNLGFVPEAGIPELYPYSEQAEPFLLPPSQTLSSPETSSVRRESLNTQR